MTIHKDLPLSNILWYKIGGTAKYVLRAKNKQDIQEAIQFIKQNNITRYFICGLGSNLVFTDDYFDGAVIQIIPSENSQDTVRMIDGQTVEAFAGSLLDTVITFGFKQNLTGLEWAGGLPGTVGAAVRGNVGAYGGEIKDVLSSAEVLVRNEKNDFELKTLTNAELNFSYRHSSVKVHPGVMIVTSAVFTLKPATADEVENAQEVYRTHIQQRKDRHPLEYPNCGSVFKNIRDKEKIEKVLQVFPDIKDRVEKSWYGKVAAGHLIQRLGLQGLRIGNAQVSTKHALFIVNLGGATAKDVNAIIATIQEKFMQTFGFNLEPEVEIVK